MTMLPPFATNRPATPDQPSQTVAQVVNQLLHNGLVEFVTPADIMIASAYFNPEGFAQIKNELRHARHVRILLGAEPQPDRGGAQQAHPDQLFAAHQQHDRDMLGFTFDASHAATELVQWLRQTGADGQPIVEVRRFCKGFLHGKAFIAKHNTSITVLSGSSNFTRAGLTSNRELNTVLSSQMHQSTDVINWYEEHWQQAEPFDLAGFYAERWQAHQPWHIFLRMLHELYGKDANDDIVDAGLSLAGFQRDGVARALRLLATHNGVLICDEVGLGKTFIAGEIIHRATRRLRQQVLLIVPAALKESTWVPFLTKYDLNFRVKVVTFHEIRDENNHALLRTIDDYAVVVIDEAHNLRNNQTQQARGLKQLLEGQYRRQVVLLTATPVNNSLNDLHSLMSYFIRNDSHFAAQGILSLKEYFREAQQVDLDTLSPDHLFEVMDQVAVRRTRQFIKEHYRGEMIPGPDGKLAPIEFPEPQVQRVDYTLHAASEQLLNAMIHALTDTPANRDMPRNQIIQRPPLNNAQLHKKLAEAIAQGRDDDAPVNEPALVRLRRRGVDQTRLSMARYMPSIFAYQPEQIEVNQITSTGLLQSALLKRLESSATALKNTLMRLQKSHETFLRALYQGIVLTGAALSEAGDYDLEEDMEQFLHDLDDDKRLGALEAKLFDSDLIKRYVEQDIQLLKVLIELADEVITQGEPKIAMLVDLLEKSALEARKPHERISANDRRKIIVFSSYPDTATMLHNAIEHAIRHAPIHSPLRDYAGRIAPVVSGYRGSQELERRSQAVAEFAPRTAGEIGPDGKLRSVDRYDILITTDVLAEGVNLQQAGQMASVDLPWNPMKLVQRHGRIDRLFSQHTTIQLHCAFPAKNVERLLNLEATLMRKIAYAVAALGNIKVLPGQIEQSEAIYQDTRDQIESVMAGRNDLFVKQNGIGYSGEAYRKRLEQELGTNNNAGNMNLRQAVLTLPHGSGSGFVSQQTRRNGYVFCATIRGHDKPWFRFVETDHNTWQVRRDNQQQPIVIDETLTALRVADPLTATTPQQISDVAQHQVFEAWDIAQQDIYHAWTKLTDIANFSPMVPLALRTACDIILKHGSKLGLPRQHELIKTFSANWDYRVVRQVRDIIGTDDFVAKKVSALDDYVKSAGLTPPESPKPLPPIALDDVQVVCWMAVEGRGQ